MLKVESSNFATPAVRLRLPHVAQVHLEELLHLQRGRVSEFDVFLAAAVRWRDVRGARPPALRKATSVTARWKGIKD